MDRSKSRIDPEDTVVLFADLQLGIAELSKTMPIDRFDHSAWTTHSTKSQAKRICIRS
jgi:hypothetical protein